MKSAYSLAGASFAALLLATAPAFSNEFAPQLEDLAKTEIAAIATAPALVEAVKSQNAASAGYNQGKIDSLDQTWRAEVDASDQPMISATLANDVSKMLAEKREGSAGLFTEIFVTDMKGLNVGQSDITSDYWQGDEAKFTETFGKGAGAIHISEIEEDESTQTFQSQVSMTVVDPATGEPIGAITVGVNVEML